MRCLRLSHAVLSVLLWCAASFAFTGTCFVAYDEAALDLQRSRVREALLELRRSIQTELDKGEGLARLKNAAAGLSGYKAADSEVSAVSVFDFPTGKVLYGTDSSKIGEGVPVEWYEKCRVTDEIFIQKEQGKKAVGVSLMNSFGEKSGCAVVEYDASAYEKGRESMMASALRSALSFSAAGVLFFGFLYVLFFLKRRTRFSFFNKPLYRRLAFGIVLLVAVAVLPSAVSSVFSSFETVLKEAIANKAGVIAGIVRTQVSKAVAGGVPFKSMQAVEPYLDGIRRRHPEILFILLTDKSGRVLYESGSAVEAFESDAATGKVFLRKGFYNAAEPVSTDGKTEGWVQIGVRERFVREKIF